MGWELGSSYIQKSGISFLNTLLSIRLIQQPKIILLQIRVPVIILANPISFTKLTLILSDQIRYELDQSTARLIKIPTTQIKAVLHTFSKERVKLSIVWVIVTPQKLQNALEISPASTNTSNNLFENICEKYREGISVQAVPEVSYTHLLPAQGHGMNERMSTSIRENMVPYTPSHPTIWSGLTLYYFINFCSYAQRNPLKIKEVTMRIQPIVCRFFIKLICTYEPFTILFSARKMSASPTIANPITASPHPTICLLLIQKSISQQEKISVVTMLAPLSIMKVEPEIRARALH